MYTCRLEIQHFLHSHSTESPAVSPKHEVVSSCQVYGWCLKLKHLHGQQGRGNSLLVTHTRELYHQQCENTDKFTSIWNFKCQTLQKLCCVVPFIQNTNQMNVTCIDSYHIVITQGQWLVKNEDAPVRRTLLSFWHWSCVQSCVHLVKSHWADHSWPGHKIIQKCKSN